MCILQGSYSYDAWLCFVIQCNYLRILAGQTCDFQQGTSKSVHLTCRWRLSCHRSLSTPVMKHRLRLRFFPHRAAVRHNAPFVCAAGANYIQALHPSRSDTTQHSACGGDELSRPSGTDRPLHWPPHAVG